MYSKRLSNELTDSVISTTLALWWYLFQCASCYCCTHPAS